jgi:hypothetical protein
MTLSSLNTGPCWTYSKDDFLTAGPLNLFGRGDRETQEAPHGIPAAEQFIPVEERPASKSMLCFTERVLTDMVLGIYIVSHTQTKDPAVYCRMRLLVMVLLDM